MANVVVVFYSRYGETESLALIAGVGVIQGRALLRLRRLPDQATDERIACDPSWTENRARMAREYIAPRPIDIEWATAFVHILRDGDDGEAAAFQQELAQHPNKLVVTLHAGATREQAISAGRKAAGLQS